MLHLKSLVGQIVIARIPTLDPEEIVMVRLRKVETTGILLRAPRFYGPNDALIRSRCLTTAAPSTCPHFVGPDIPQRGSRLAIRQTCSRRSEAWSVDFGAIVSLRL